MTVHREGVSRVSQPPSVGCQVRGAAVISDASLIVLRHKLQRERPFNLPRERRFDFAPQHGQRDRMAASLTIRRRRMVAIEFGT